MLSGLANDVTVHDLAGKLKDAAWGPMNSNVHAGIRPVVRRHIGFPPELAATGAYPPDPASSGWSSSAPRCPVFT
jgi:hypothetical protein